MSTLYVRSYNPIWNFRSLTGLPLDDNSYVYFLANTIPYLNQPVYHTDSGTLWNNPVQLSAAGTVSDIFMDPALVYRLEVRTNDGTVAPSQADALVWLIENYVPSDGGAAQPITSGNITANNQITNPQFSLVNFETTHAFTGINGQTISVAPGWDLVLTGTTQNVTVTQVPLDSSDNVSTNAPYALRMNLSGWTTAFLRQRFDQAGTLWAGKYVSTSVTALLEGAPQEIVVTMVDSFGVTLGTLLTTNISAQFETYPGGFQFPDSTNTDVPPAAYVDYLIKLPTTGDIYLTSIQVVPGEVAVNLPYEQTTIERQVDQTYHVNRDSIIFQPKPSILTGWDFPLNPWQFRSTASSNLSGFGNYVTDQTIVISEITDSIKVGTTTAPLNALDIKSIIGTAQGRIAVIQFIDPATIAGHWESTLSSLTQMLISTSVNSEIPVKMSLIHSDSLPATISAVEPIASWGADGAIFTAQWSELKPVNDPAYTLATTLTDAVYNGFVTPAKTGATATLGIVLQTTVAMSDAAVDSWILKNVSLVHNDFALQSNSLTWDETLRACEYYYEKSYAKGVLPGTVTDVGVRDYTSPIDRFNGDLSRRAFTLNFNSVKRADPSVVFYSPTAATASRLLLQINRGAALAPTTTANPLVVLQSTYTQHAISNRSTTYYSNDASQAILINVANSADEGLTLAHHTLDSRLGI